MEKNWFAKVKSQHSVANTLLWMLLASPLVYKSKGHHHHRCRQSKWLTISVLIRFSNDLGSFYQSCSVSSVFVFFLPELLVFACVTQLEERKSTARAQWSAMTIYFKVKSLLLVGTRFVEQHLLYLIVGDLTFHLTFIRSQKVKSEFSDPLLSMILLISSQFFKSNSSEAFGSCESHWSQRCKQFERKNIRTLADESWTIDILTSTGLITKQSKRSFEVLMWNVVHCESCEESAFNALDELIVKIQPRQHFARFLMSDLRWVVGRPVILIISKRPETSI